MTLKNCKFNYGGLRLLKNELISYRDVKPEELVQVEHQFVPKRAENQTIVATFTSNELIGITGSASVYVYLNNKSNK